MVSKANLNIAGQNVTQIGIHNRSKKRNYFYQINDEVFVLEENLFLQLFFFLESKPHILRHFFDANTSNNRPC